MHLLQVETWTKEQKKFGFLPYVLLAITESYGYKS